MIFSKEKWNESGEIKQYIAVSKAISFEKMESPLRNAFDLFLVSLLGESMTNRLQEIYDSENRSEREEKLLFLAQRANANLAFWYEFDEINLRITDSGFQRQDTESFKSLFKYQEDHLKQNFKNTGFNALDNLLAFLEKETEVFPEYLQSPAYILFKESIVRNTEEVNGTYFINNSRIVFLRLRTHFDFAEKTFLCPALGDKLYEELKRRLREGVEDEIQRAKTEELRIRSGRVIIMEAVRRLLMETGSLTDRGLYFTSIHSGAQTDENEAPVEIERLSSQVRGAETDREVYLTSLMKYVRQAFADWYEGNPQKVFDRNNDHKRTFWA
ncbi:hypothetical protein EZS27_015614 [termite gut metagenome]|uniref:Uncharacterized protein n=1 Tax=termite gut metagenome TaxID=433724 RepID=A0A5J4RRE5_9ZZZZ